MPTSIVHVEPNSRGRWIVRQEGDPEPLSEHESASEAERVARDVVRLEDTALVLLHDRYARVHPLDTRVGR